MMALGTQHGAMERPCRCRRADGRQKTLSSSACIGRSDRGKEYRQQANGRQESADAIDEVNARKIGQRAQYGGSDTAQPIRRPEVVSPDFGGAGRAPRVALCALYQVLTRISSSMASSAPPENQAMLRWPCGSTMKAASSGPSDDPLLPPSANSACAKPWRPPDAMRAMREASG